MVVDDLFTLEQLGPVAVSPNGEWLAIVIARARTNAETYRDFPSATPDADHADVWLLARRGGERRNITNGLADGSGYWNPVWSPDGKRMALLSTKGGDNIRPYVWEMATGTLSRVTHRGADLQAIGDEGWPNYAMVWQDSTTLLCAVLPNGAPPSYYGMTKNRSYSTAAREWAKAQAGVEPSVSVLKSGRAVPTPAPSQGQLLAIDVVSGKSRVVADGNVRDVRLSPTRRDLALIVETGRIPPRPGQELSREAQATDLARTRLALLSLEQEVAKAVWVDPVIDPKPAAPWVPLPHSWSPDGTSFVVIARHSKDDETATALFRVSAATGAARQVADRQLEVRATAWTSGGELLAFGRHRPMAEWSNDSTRFDWWAIDHRRTRGRARKLTGELEVVPTALFRTPERNTLLGIASGDLWSIDVRNGTAKNATDTFTPEIQDVVWPTLPRHQAHASREVIVTTRGNELYLVTWTSAAARTKLLPRPSNGATLAEFFPERQLIVYTAAESNGTFLWTSDGSDAHVEQRIALNEQLAGIADAKRMLIEYRGVEGDSLKGLLILPIGYEAGKRYPLITVVYGGRTITDTVSWSGWDYFVNKQSVTSLNLHLLPSRGYALMIPSVPLPPWAERSDPYIDIPKGVIAAVDKVIELGIADPERLGVMGHSYGGYSTYSLVTYTRRYKAAIALAGFANVVSLYGTFDALLRYDNRVHEDLFFARFTEVGQGRMGNAYWADLGRYLRNSPLYYVDRVETPLMIIQGDMDYVPIQQGEEFFTALYRMGKKAEFVRYWGEGHVISSPANTRDMWQRVFDWFDELLEEEKQPPVASRPSGRSGFKEPVQR